MFPIVIYLLISFWQQLWISPFLPFYKFAEDIISHSNIKDPRERHGIIRVNDDLTSSVQGFLFLASCVSLSDFGFLLQGLSPIIGKQNWLRIWKSGHQKYLDTQF